MSGIGLKNIKVYAIAAVFATPILGVVTTQAQEAGARLEEVVVTARKREENLQESALSVSALTGGDLDRRFASDIRDLASISPNLIIDDLQQGPGSPTAITLRGYGVSDVEKNLEPTTVVVLDGVAMGANSGSMLKALDLEKIEILRGPQGTLFGKNAVAGVINLTRTRPTGELGGKVRVGYADYDNTSIEGVLNFGTEAAAFKISASNQNQREGFLTNLVDGKDSGRTEYSQVTLNALFAVTESLELELTYTDDEQKQDGHTALTFASSGSVWCAVYNYCSPGPGQPLTGDRYTVNNNDPKMRDAFFESETGIVELRWDMTDTMKIDYIYGFKDTSEEVWQDWDGTPVTLYHTARPAEYSQDSHELRLTTSFDGPLNGVFGLYKWDSDYTIPISNFIGFGEILGIPNFPVTRPQPVVIEPDKQTWQETDSWSIFFEADYDISEQLKLTVGGRYINEEKMAKGCEPIGSCVVTDAQANAEWSDFTPKVALSYQINDDVMVYGLYSQGFRSGGFSGRWATIFELTTPYKPETVTNMEVGMKSEWLDNRLRLNLTFFDLEVEDKQFDASVSNPDASTGQGTLMTNVGVMESSGVELEMIALLGSNFSADLNVGYLDTEFTDFTANVLGTGIADYTYLEPTRAPELTYTVGLNFEAPVGQGVLYARASAHFIDEHEMSQINSSYVRNDSQTLVDVSVTYSINQFDVSLYGKNLTDEDGYTVGYDVGGMDATGTTGGLWTFAMARAPQIWGVNLTYAF